MSQTYNGWKNYETWAVNLWNGNDEGSYRYWLDVAEECAKDADATNYSTRQEEFVSALADRMKSEFDEAQPDLGSTVWADLLGAALSEVDWYELAEHYVEHVQDILDESDEEESDE